MHTAAPWKDWFRRRNWPRGGRCLQHHSFLCFHRAGNPLVLLFCVCNCSLVVRVCRPRQRFDFATAVDLMNYPTWHMERSLLFWRARVLWHRRLTCTWAVARILLSMGHGFDLLFPFLLHSYEEEMIRNWNELLRRELSLVAYHTNTSCIHTVFTSQPYLSSIIMNIYHRIANPWDSWSDGWSDGWDKMWRNPSPSVTLMTD